MSRFPTTQSSGNTLKNPAQVWAKIKSTSTVNQQTQELNPPHIRVYFGKGFATAAHVDFLSGSHVYRVEGETPEGTNVNSAFFADFNTPFKMYLPGAPLMTYKELKSDVAWKTNDLKLVRYTWGVLRYIDATTGEANSVSCMLGLTNGFQDFDKNDLGTLRKLTAGGGELVKAEKGEFRKLLIEAADPESDPETDKVFEEFQSQFVLYFRQFIPGYLSQYFDADGQPVRFDGK